MKDEKMENEKEKMPEKEIPEQEQDKVVPKNETLEASNPDKSPPDDEEDLLYTHKPENRVGGIQWNSTFCRKIGR